MVKGSWKIISVLMSLVAFLVVGCRAINVGEDLLWTAGKAVVSFFACYIVLSNLGGMLLAVIGPEEEPDRKG